MIKEETISPTSIKHLLKRIWKLFLSSFRHIALFALLLFFSSYQTTTTNIKFSYLDYYSISFQNFAELQLEFNIDVYKSYNPTSLEYHIDDIMLDFYQLRNYKAAWTYNRKTNANFRNFITFLKKVKYYGFPYKYFNRDKILILKDELRKIKRNDDEILNKRLELELATTYSAIKLMIYFNKGIIEADTSASFIQLKKALPVILNNAIENKLIESILSIQPQIVQYHNLLEAMPQFVTTYEAIDFFSPTFVDDELLANGFYYAGIIESAVFDTAVNKIKALHEFQKEYNFPLDTVLSDSGRNKLASLLKYRYFQACLNLDRLRKLENIDNNYLFVNIPEFKLHVVEENIEKETFNVIVGKKRTPTPRFSSYIEKVITNPYWTVPKSIVNNEMIHKIRKDSTYLAKHGYFIIDYRENAVDGSQFNWNEENPLGERHFLRQRNSGANALGQVKFVFPNKYNVYLHDTPSKNLFSRKVRTFSHGCVRLQNPDKLAQYISNAYYSAEDEIEINKLISSKRRYVIELSKQIAIHIQYITCLAKKDSKVSFFNDVYNKDIKDIKAIFSEPTEI